MENTFSNTFTFYSVGHGLFYTGSLNDKSFNFIYDCGSKNHNFLNVKIIDYISSLKKKNINFIVISHLHRDHFNGLQKLLKGVNYEVKKIFLPYIFQTTTEDDRQLIAFYLISIILYSDIKNFNDDEYNENLETLDLILRLYNVYDASFEIVDDDNLKLSIDNVVYVKEFENIDDINKNFEVSVYWKFYLLNKHEPDEKIKDKIKKLRNDVTNALKKECIICNENDLCSGLVKYFKKIQSNSAIVKIYKNFNNSFLCANNSSTILLHYPVNQVKHSALYRENNDLKEFQAKYLLIEGETDNDEEIEIFNDDNAASLLTGDISFNELTVNQIIKLLNQRNLMMVQLPHHGSHKNYQDIKKHLLQKVETEFYVISHSKINKNKPYFTATIEDLTKTQKNFWLVNEETGNLVYINGI